MKKIIIYFIVISLLTSVFSCKKYVAVGPPVQQQVSLTVFSDANSATAAVLGIYTGMQNLTISSQYSLYNGLLADEFKNFASGGLNLSYYTNNLLPTNYTTQWQVSYPELYQANSIIEGLQQTAGLVPAVKQQLMGEAKFSRAFCLFYLGATYGAVPIPLGTDYLATAALARSPEGAVYNQAISDLKEAQNLLNSGFVDVSDTTVYALGSEERVRPTKFAAAALLARVYLYQKDYPNAYAQSSAVINNTTLFNLEPNLKNVFLKNSREAIWQLMPSNPSTTNTNDATTYILLGPPTGNKVAVSQQLLGSFEANDRRQTNWLGSVSKNGVTYYFPFKYTNKTSTITEYTMVLRLAEQYLIRAEAEAYGAGGGLSAAVNDLNMIRNRAGLPNYAGPVDQQSLLTAILHERQVELFSEWGHRWYDLRRTGTINAVMSVVAPQKNTTWNPDGHQALYPIPQPDMLNDKNLTQNPGY